MPTLATLTANYHRAATKVRMLRSDLMDAINCDLERQTELHRMLVLAEAQKARAKAALAARG